MNLTPPLPARTLTVSGLACRRGERLLFTGLNVSLSAGEALLLRGPNGAGKTTLLHALAGIVTPEAGTITIEGRDPEARPGTDLHLIGHLPGIKARLTVQENLAFWAAINGGNGAVEAALETVGLGAIPRLQAGHLSAGQTRRLALGRLLVSPRPIWLLDEPTAALDTAGEALVGRLIDAHLDAGGMMIAATHHDLALSRPPRTLAVGKAD
ncbi:heme ABC exporter ATP-binding protein CcmA [Arsenicitalea aurantiaca]|uniref:Heme ABC exporter ATP-binding protein CcmA n=1 Tax=Arsenicitalea aurantiaca TaxID=1783274 RepID=A0A433X7H4_9HYPH|nr:heme ABC exporter ATP-binding protein CcmA [Arsenicitalea aurantiaca]RUT30026.1 heme ABC exporter ATP-binding protein CcmA [Arsenicitalea aurantiaca]